MGQFNRNTRCHQHADAAIRATAYEHSRQNLPSLPVRERIVQIVTDCDAAAASVADVEYLHDVAFDREQYSVDVRPAAVKKLPYFNR